MRALTYLLFILSALWSGYWFVGKNQLETRVGDMLGQAPAYGVSAQYAGFNVEGFPNRFDTTVENINLRDSVTGLGWEAPFFQVFALSYRPNHIIAVWPEHQVLHFGPVAVNVSSSDMRASVIMGASTDLPLSSTRFVASDLTIAVQGSDEETRSAQVFWATRRSAASEFSHDMMLQIADVTLTPQLQAYLDPTGTYPDQIEGLNIDSTVAFDGVLGPQSPARPTGITVRSASLQWGELKLTVTGELVVAPTGYLEGVLDMTVENWRETADVLSRIGLLQPGWADAAEPLVQGAENPDQLITQIRYERGLVYFGPLAIGTAPRLF